MPRPPLYFLFFYFFSVLAGYCSKQQVAVILWASAVLGYSIVFSYKKKICTQKQMFAVYILQNICCSMQDSIFLVGHKCENTHDNSVCALTFHKTVICA